MAAAPPQPAGTDPGGGRRRPTEVRVASAASQAAFTKDLANALAQLAAKYHDEAAEGGRTFRFTIAGHPAPLDATDARPSEAG